MELISQAKESAFLLADELKRTGYQIVFAESCTAGLVSAALAQVPGISQHLCGSSVTYQELTKQQWLAVDEDVLQKYTAVSEAVTAQMATNVLGRTTQAMVSAAVTGHLGPNVDEELDGIGYMAIAVRNNLIIECQETIAFKMQETHRVSRQWEVTNFVLNTVTEYLSTV